MIEERENGRLNPWELKGLMIDWFSYDRAKSLERLCDKYSIGWAMGWKLGQFPADPETYLVDLFLAYVEDCKGRWIILKDMKARNKSEKFIKFPYVFRGCKQYMGRQIAKFERLKRWIIENKRQFLHLTFSPQASEFDSIIKCLEKMKENRNTLLQYLRDRGIDNLEYIWVMEPHESGYPHFHVLVFAPWIPEIQDLGKWWEKHDLGEYNGVDWEGPYDPQRSKKVVGYLTKYISKQFGKKAFGEEYEEGVECDDGLTDFPEAENGNKKLLFWSALLWITRSRSYSCSREVSKAMKNPTKGGGGEVWTCKGEIISRFIFVGSIKKSNIDIVHEIFDGDFQDYFKARGYG